MSLDKFRVGTRPAFKRLGLAARLEQTTVCPKRGANNSQAMENFSPVVQDPDMTSLGRAQHPRQKMSLQIVLLVIARDVKGRNPESVFSPFNAADANVDIAGQKNHVGIVLWSGEEVMFIMKVG